MDEPYMEYRIRQYELEQGALEIQYIEEFFGEFPRRKTAPEVEERLQGRLHSILMAEAALPGDPSTILPVSYKISHEIHATETDPKLIDLVARLHGCVQFEGRRVLYQWIGATRRDWRGQGFFRALSEEQEVWAIAAGFDEVVVKTKNRFYDMRSTLAALGFNVIKFEPNAFDSGEAKVYHSKRLSRELLDAHQKRRTVVHAA